MRLCPGSRSVIFNYDACLLRYSDTRFFAVAEFSYSANRDTNVFMQPGHPNATDRETMIAVRSDLIEELVHKAGDWPNRFYNYSLPYTDRVLGTDVISGLAQCTRDLAPSECSRCLSAYTHLVSQLVQNDSSGIGIKGFSCYLRYQLGTIKITAPPLPALPPPPPPTSPSPRSKSCSRDLVTCNLYFWKLSHVLNTK
jgi:hypothetical protein